MVGLPLFIGPGLLVGGRAPFLTGGGNFTFIDQFEAKVTLINRMVVNITLIDRFGVKITLIDRLVV